MTLDMRLLTLVPNHLSTVKKQQKPTSITNPKSTKPPKKHSQNQKPHHTWPGSEKESGGYHTIEDAEEKR